MSTMLELSIPLNQFRAIKIEYEMESAIKKTSAQVDRTSVIVRMLETESAEIRAELEASKLSASESVTVCVEVAKRERRCLKKLVAWEKQEKMQEEIAEKRKKIVQVQQQLAKVKESTKQVELSLHHFMS